MALSLAKAVLDCLKSRPEEKLTARQIAEWIFSAYPAEYQEKNPKAKAVTSKPTVIGYSSWLQKLVYGERN